MGESHCGFLLQWVMAPWRTGTCPTPATHPRSSAPCPVPLPPSPQVVGLVGGLGMSWQATFGVILALYFYSHYFFASGELSGGWWWSGGW